MTAKTAEEFAGLAAKISARRATTADERAQNNSAFWRAHDYGVRTYGASRFIPLWREQEDRLRDERLAQIEQEVALYLDEMANA